MSITVSVEMVPDIGIVVEHLESWKALDSISHKVLILESLLVRCEMLIYTDVTHGHVRSTKLEFLARYIPLQHPQQHKFHSCTLKVTNKKF